MEPLLEVRDLSIQFESGHDPIQAVRGASFSLYPGETLAIVGESGCGKSVMCKSILNLLSKRGRITGGGIHYQGNPLLRDEKSLAKIRGNEISILFQNPASALNPTISVGKQIAEAILTHQSLSRRDADQRVLELLTLVGISNPKERYNQYPHEFSGGMLQRAVIAAALSCNPKILIADEPTTALDVTIQAQILDLLANLQKKTGIAILLVTHDLGVVAKTAHRVAVMYAGKIVETGTARDIFHDPRHPYTWALLASLPGAEFSGEPWLLPGTPPDLSRPPKGDAFAFRNRYALAVDYEEEPPVFQISETHSAATWLLHPDAPRIPCPVTIEEGRVKIHG